MQRTIGLGFTVALLTVACSVHQQSPSTRQAAVASATPEATRAGLDVLQRGGNAIDAAVAVSLALGVSEPAGSGIGGQVFILMCKPGEPAVVIDGSTRAPAVLPDRVQRTDLDGHRATTVPSALAVLDFAHRRHGSGKMSWSELVLPAARIAEEGPSSGPFRRASVLRYGPEGLDERLPLLAQTLRTIAERGATEFYHGDIARQIANDMAANGGWITYDDLTSFPEPTARPALRGTYRGNTVYTLPPPAAGWVVMMALNLLEQVPIGELESEQGWALHMSHALRRAHTARMNAPVGDATERGDLLREHLKKPGSGETTHFSVVDGDGVMVAVTQSLNNYFGAKVAHPRLGFLYNDYMREFVTDDPGHAFALAPRAQPLSSMSASILTQAGKPVLAVGSPGSRRIISAVVQVISNWVDQEMPLEAAVAAPRLHVVPETVRLFVEQGLAPPYLMPRTLLALEQSGLRIVTPHTSLDRMGLSPYFGGVHAVSIRGSQTHAVADPRRDGVGTVIHLPRATGQ